MFKFTLVMNRPIVYMYMFGILKNGFLAIYYVILLCFYSGLFWYNMLHVISKLVLVNYIIYFSKYIVLHMYIFGEWVVECGAGGYFIIFVRLTCLPK